MAGSKVVVLKTVFGAVNVIFAGYALFLFGLMISRVTLSKGVVFLVAWPELVMFFCFLGNAAGYLCKNKIYVGLFYILLNLCLGLFAFSSLYPFETAVDWFVYLCVPANIAVFLCCSKRVGKRFLHLANLFLFGYGVWFFAMAGFHFALILSGVIFCLIAAVGYFVIINIEHGIEVIRDE